MNIFRLSYISSHILLRRLLEGWEQGYGFLYRHIYSNEASFIPPLEYATLRNLSKIDVSCRLPTTQSVSGPWCHKAANCLWCLVNIERNARKTWCIPCPRCHQSFDPSKYLVGPLRLSDVHSWFCPLRSQYSIAQILTISLQFKVLWILNPLRTALMMALNIIRSVFPAFRGYSQVRHKLPFIQWLGIDGFFQALIVDEVRNSFTQQAHKWHLSNSFNLW